MLEIGNRRHKLMIVTLCIFACAFIIGGGILAYAGFRGGQYSELDGAYFLNREDAQTTYKVRMPTDIHVSAAQARQSLDTRKVTLTYSHSEKGENHNWDIYTDESENRYTYHELTGQLVSVLYLSPQVPEAAVAPTEELVLAYSEQYLTAMVPDFSQYELVNYRDNTTEGGTAARNAYMVSYGLKIGDFFASDRIHLSFTSGGCLLDATFPQNTAYVAMTSREKENLAARLPSQEDVEQQARTAMQEKYGDRLTSMSVNDVILQQKAGRYELAVSIDAHTELTKGDGMPVGMFETLTIPIE